MHMLITLLLALVTGCEDTTTPITPTPMPPDPGGPTMPEPGGPGGIPEPFPVVSGTYTGVVTYTEPGTGCSVRGDANVGVSQQGERLSVHAELHFGQSECPEGSFQGAGSDTSTGGETLNDETGRAPLEWRPDSDPNPWNPSSCGYPFSPPTGTLTFSGTRMHYMQTVVSPSCPPGEISGTLVRGG